MGAILSHVHPTCISQKRTVRTTSRSGSSDVTARSPDYESLSNKSFSIVSRTRSSGSAKEKVSTSTGPSSLRRLDPSGSQVRASLQSVGVAGQKSAKEELRQNSMNDMNKHGGVVAAASASKITTKSKSFSKSKYAFIPDNYSSIDQVTAALRDAGLESSNLILGIDFTKSNEWTGKRSFNNKSLHAIGDTPNPYEKAISIIGKTLAPFDEDNLIPCFGFGDATTHDQAVFSFHSDNSPCYGFEEVLACYRKIVPSLKLSGPTSYAPVIEAAIDIVEKSGGQYHVLIIIADGQVTRSVDTSEDDLSPQEEKTIKAIVNASSYPLSIVLVGVGDGPWDDMKRFDDKIPSREIDNFQFVNFTAIMTRDASPSQRETAFALAALMEIPIQYKATLAHKMLGRTTGRAKKIVPRPPPVPYGTNRAMLQRAPSSISSPNDADQACAICLTNRKDLAFGCGHMTCRECGSKVSNCPICRQRITSRLRLYT